MNARGRRKDRRERLRLVPPGLDGRKWETMVESAEGDPAAEAELRRLQVKVQEPERAEELAPVWRRDDANDEHVQAVLRDAVEVAATATETPAPTPRPTARRAVRPKPARRTARRLVRPVTAVTDNLPTDVASALVAGAAVTHHGGRRFRVSYPRVKTEGTRAFYRGFRAAVKARTARLEAEAEAADAVVAAAVSPDAPSPLEGAFAGLGRAMDEARNADRSDIANVADAIRALAEKPPTPITVNLPQQPAPIVNVTPEIVVNVPEPSPQPTPAPVVVAAAPPQRPSRILVEFDAQGAKSFRPVYDEDDE